MNSPIPIIRAVIKSRRVTDVVDPCPDFTNIGGPVNGTSGPVTDNGTYSVNIMMVTDASVEPMDDITELDTIISHFIIDVHPSHKSQ